MDLRAVLIAICKLVLSGLVAFLCWFAIIHSPLWPQSAAGSQLHANDQHQTGKDHKPENGHAAAPHEPDALHHVMDTHHWEIYMAGGGLTLHLPAPFGFQITKFMILEVIAALLICAVFIPLGKKINEGGVTKGAYGNFFEVFLTFVRDQIAKPSIGEHDADRFVPFLWTMFLFILFNNLLGMVPLGGSATASLFVTGALALIVFFYMHGAGVAKMGLGRYIGSLWPHMDVPFAVGLFIKPLIFCLEWVGVLVRNAVLAVRLFANMFAGHMVLATLLIFIYLSRDPGNLAGELTWAGITLSSVLGIIALSLLELFVAFLQAYIFTFLTALFMGMALHPEH